MDNYAALIRCARGGYRVFVFAYSAALGKGNLDGKIMGRAHDDMGYRIYIESKDMEAHNVLC
jgi:hypothetical protein